MTTAKTYSAAGDAVQNIARAVARCRERNRSVKKLAKAGEFDMAKLDAIDELVLQLAVNLERRAEGKTL